MVVYESFCYLKILITVNTLYFNINKKNGCNKTLVLEIHNYTLFNFTISLFVKNYRGLFKKNRWYLINKMFI